MSLPSGVIPDARTAVRPQRTTNFRGTLSGARRQVATGSDEVVQIADLYSPLVELVWVFILAPFGSWRGSGWNTVPRMEPETRSGSSTGR
jgi:hypothetical protein